MADTSVKHVGLRMTLDASSLKTESQAAAQALGDVATRGEAAATRTATALTAAQAAAAKAGQALLSQAEMVTALESATTKYTVEEEKLLRGLAAEVQMYGMTAAQAERYVAVQRGMSAVAAEAAAGLRAKIETQKAEAAAIMGVVDATQRHAQQQQAFLASMSRQADTMGMSNRQLAEYQAAQLGVSDKAAPMIAKLYGASDALDHTGMSTKQTAQALRMLPMQMTDIAVGLSTGQSPFMVMMQQGGQLKDMFGGVGGAAKAVGGYVLGMINPLTLGAGAVLALGTAAYKGSQEQTAYANALVLSGGAAGVSASQMSDMARELASGTRTQSAAAAAVTEMARSTAVGAQELQRYAGIAADWERVTGQSVTETAEKFKRLKDDPLQASVKLNEGLNYLTASTYEHIKALKDQGKNVEAVRVAQEAYANAIAERTPQMVQNLGFVEKAWQGIRGAAARAWDAMANVGRQQSLGDQIADVQQKIRDAKGQNANRPFAMPWDTSLTDLQNQLASLREAERLERRMAEAKAENIRVQSEGVAATEAVSKANEKALTKQEQMNKALAEYRANIDKVRAANPDSALLDPAKIAAAEKAIRDQYTDLKAGKDAAREMAQELSLLAKSAGLNPDFYKEWEKLNALHAKGKMDVEALTAAQAKLLAQQPVIKQAEEARRKETEALAKAEATARDEALRRVQAHAKEVDQLAAGNDKLRDEIATLGLSAREQTRYAKAKLDSAISIKEEQLARMQGQWLYTREQAALEEEIRLLRERSELLGQKADRELDIEGAKAVEKTEKATEQMGQALADNIMRGGKSARQYLIDLMRTTVLRPILAPIGTAMAGLFGGTGAALAGQAGGGGSALGLMGNVGSMASNLFGGVTGNFLGGGTFGAMMANVGAGFTTGMTTLFTEGISAAFSQATGLMAAGSTGGGLGALAGAAAPLAIGGLLLGNALGLFRTTERKGGGLTGTLGQAGGVHDVDLMRRGGTLFSGPDWFTDDKGVSALDRAIQQQFDLSKGAIKGFAETLGLSTEKIDGFTTALGTETMGDHGQLGIRLDKDGKPLSDQEVQQAIAEAIKAGSNELAQELIGTWSESVERVTRTVVQTTGGLGDSGWQTRQVDEDVTTRSYSPSEFAREGEQAIDTLTRLATSLQGTNALFDTLGLALYQSSMAGGDMASQMADAAGGLDKLQASGAAYFQAFYTGSEQHQTALRQLREQFDALGLAMPANRAGLRQMMEGIDRTTEAGRTLTAQLLELAPQLAAVMPQLFEAGNALADQLRQGLLGTFEGENLGAAMAQTVQDGIYNAIAGQFANQITDIIVAGVVDPVIQAAVTGSSISAAVSQASIDQMVAQATAVAAAAAAVLNDPAFQEAMGRVGQAVAAIHVPAVRAATSVRSYASAVDRSADSTARAADAIANERRGLMRQYWQLVGDTAALRADELAQLDPSNRALQERIWALQEEKDAQDKVKQAADEARRAWLGTADSLVEQINRIRGTAADSGGQSLAYWQAQFAIATAKARAGDVEAAASLSGLSESLLSAADEQAGSLLELQRIRAQVADSLQSTAQVAHDWGQDGSTLPGMAQPPASTPAPLVLADPGLRADTQAVSKTFELFGVAMLEKQAELVRIFRRWALTSGMAEN